MNTAEKTIPAEDVISHYFANRLRSLGVTPMDLAISSLDFVFARLVMAQAERDHYKAALDAIEGKGI
jgi:hypothetical protein